MKRCWVVAAFLLACHNNDAPPPGIPPSADASIVDPADEDDEFGPDADDDADDDDAEADTPEATPDAGRPDEDVARDELRKPQEIMDLFGVKPGTKVVELMAGGGYYVDLLSRRVGPEGKVWAHNTPFVLERFAEGPISERLTNPALANVTRLDTELEDPKIPSGVEVVMLVNFYHDLYWQKVDRAKMNAAVFAALEPGGVFGIVDHTAKKGRGSKDTKTLHRVEPSLVIKEVEKAGFRLVEQSELLKHPEDDHQYNVFEPPAGRDKTDRFVLKFEKPAG